MDMDQMDSQDKVEDQDQDLMGVFKQEIIIREDLVEETLEGKEETASMVGQEDLEQDQVIMGDFKEAKEHQDSQEEILEGQVEAQGLVKVDSKVEL